MTAPQKPATKMIDKLVQVSKYRRREPTNVSYSYSTARRWKRRAVAGERGRASQPNPHRRRSANRSTRRSPNVGGNSNGVSLTLRSQGLHTRSGDDA
jgi:hypothetical protein